jgi:hypothetical protein
MGKVGKMGRMGKISKIVGWGIVLAGPASLGLEWSTVSESASQRDYLSSLGLTLDDNIL